MFCLIHKNKFDGKLKGMVHQVVYENDHTFFFPRHIRRYYNYSYIDSWVDSKFSIVKPRKFKFTSELRDAQVDMSKDIFDSFAETGYIHGIIQARPGTGKCHGKDTPILMYDGSIKMVQDIINGDLVMGPDSKPRIVSGVTVGYGDMYEVIPNKGDSFTCNDDHVLSLKSSYSDSKRYPFDSITNISIEDYLKQTNRFKAKMKLWRTGVEFPTVDIPFDPYIIGAYLGDGTKKETCSITISHDAGELFEYLFDWFDNTIYNVGYTDIGSGCTTYNIITDNRSIRNDFRFYVREHLITENNDRNIPNEYLINDREVRLQLLAGIIDTDGNLSSGGYEVFCKGEHFADQICFLSRSLGLSCYKKEKITTIKSLGFTGLYYRCFISGHTNEIPCKVEYKKAPERKQIKNVLKSGFEVKYIGKDNYYGFTLDKDHLYLMGDFTVTHNTVLGIYLAHKLNVVTLVVIDNKKIVEQWIEEMLRHTDLERSDIGTIKGDVFDVDDKVIIVSTPQTLSSKFKNANKTFYPKFRDIGIGLVIWDEVHVIGREWAAGSLLFNTPNLLGMSATPWHGKDKEILMYSIFGEVVTKYGEYDFSPKYKMVEYDSLTGDKDGKRVNYLWKNNFNMARSVYNKVLLGSKAWVDICVEIMKHNMEADPNNRMIVIVFTEKQINVLYDAAIKVGLEPIKFYAKQREVDKDKDRLLIATMAYGSKAFDYKQLNRMLLAIPILGKKAMVQSIGRILRECAGKEDAEVWDLYDIGSGYRGLFLNTIDQKLRIINNEYDDVIVDRGSIAELTK